MTKYLLRDIFKRPGHWNFSLTSFGSLLRLFLSRFHLLRGEG